MLNMLNAFTLIRFLELLNLSATVISTRMAERINQVAQVKTLEFFQHTFCLLSSNLLDALCDHGRAFSFFAESLNNNQFWARRCNNINEISGVCTGPEALMAGEPGNYLNNVFGIYALRTNANPPFAQGRF